ncbi:MAG: SMC-Scp complex subunit ScpB [Candidatus Melainabacteria bacterium]|nr:SMC-Scp complex subunit ScpB [Candidatus Melainabacteria bacterium]
MPFSPKAASLAEEEDPIPPEPAHAEDALAPDYFGQTHFGESDAGIPNNDLALRNIPLKGLLETALFLTGRPLSIAELAELAETTSDAVEEALMMLLQDYAYRGEDCALEINDIDGYILQVKPLFQPMINKLLPMELSAGAVRTLSAIAIKAPVLQSDLIELRGTNAYEHIQELLAKRLISKKRQGRSYALNLTPAFHQHFRLNGDRKALAFLVDGL